MVQNVYEVFSAQELKVYKFRFKEKKSIKEIASILECSPNTVKEYCKRIKKKITALDLMDNVTLIYEPENEIEDIFNEENERTLCKKTVNQVQFLSESNKMSCKRSPEATRQMRRHTGTAKTVVTRQMTEAERANMSVRKVARLPDPSVTSAYAQYNRWYDDPPDLDTMAALEVVLRAHGLIYRTPYINKLNRATSVILRAQESDYRAVIVKQGEGELIPPGSKYVESVKDVDGKRDYSVWLFPSNFCCPITKRKSNII